MKQYNLVQSSNCPIGEIVKWIGFKEGSINWTGNKFSYPVMPGEFRKFYSSNEVHRLMLENNAGEVVAYGELSRINLEKRSLFL